ncbi:MAG TPA: cytochrome c [Vicinamibacterales bacterium]|nr:cytochrome c [Vicinamibacterales bacterium]
MRWVIASVAGFVVMVVLSASGARAVAPEDDLPEGEGKKILLSSCTTCHELTEVTKFRGYYNRDQWHDIVVTMKEYGASIDDRQVDVLTDYLTTHLGR